jgi:DNA-binding GntR family transcriptional regulator
MDPETATKASRHSLVERAYAEIKRRIMRNLFRPGFQILEQDLAKTLNMSRTPVREALIRLEEEGLVEILPRRGMRVVPIAVGDMREIYEVLTCLESRAAERLAARKPSDPEIAPLEEAVGSMDRALADGDLDTWAKADDLFHRTLLELCGNRRLASMAFAVSDQVHRVRRVTLHMRPTPGQSNIDHRAVVEAIRAGDSRTAHDVHYRHRQEAMELLTRILERHELTEL